MEQPTTASSTAVLSSLPAPPPPPAGAATETEPRRRHPLRTLAKLGILAGALWLSYQVDSGIFFGVVVLFALVVPFEKIYPRQKGQRIRRPLVGTDISFALLGPLLNIAGIIALIVIGSLSLF